MKEMFLIQGGLLKINENIKNGIYVVKIERSKMPDYAPNFCGDKTAYADDCSELIESVKRNLYSDFSVPQSEIQKLQYLEMQTITFSTRSARVNLEQNPSLAPFVVRYEKHEGWSGDTPHGYNHGPSTVEIQAELVHENKHIRLNGEILWADLYKTPDGDTLAVRHRGCGPRQIGLLTFLKKKDFGFEVVLDYDQD